MLTQWMAGVGHNISALKKIDKPFTSLPYPTASTKKNLSQGTEQLSYRMRIYYAQSPPPTISFS